MANSDLVRVSPRPWLLLCLWSVGGALPGVCVAGRPAPHYAELQVSIAPEPVRLPIVEATDNRFLRLSTAEGGSQTKWITWCRTTRVLCGLERDMDCTATTATPLKSSH